MIRIAIDGPSGAGKSTLAKGLAKKLGIVYVDTGALYRTVGYYVKEQGIDPSDKKKVASLLPALKIELRYEGGAQCVYLNGENLGDKIRRPEISMYASAVSAIPAVREFLLNTQKEVARSSSVVMDGRDIGTVILPDADVKIFLSASDKDRATRRYEELCGRGENVKYEDVLSEMRERDTQDRERDVAPAIPAADAVLLDNSGFTNKMSLDAALAIVNERLGLK